MSFSGRRVSILRQALQQSPDGRRFSVHKEPTAQEQESTPHLKLRDHPSHRPHAGLDTSRASTGVVWTTEQASQHGFQDDPTSWANLGQGAPEVDDDIEGSFPRPTSIEISVNGREYGPTAGIRPLREAVANLYNVQYRQGKESQYTWENVCIVPGGRAGLIRIAAVLGNVMLGFFIPDYTAYNEMLSLFKNFIAIPTPLSSSDGYHVHADKVAEELARGTRVILTSNPRNPTGHALDASELKLIQDICRDRATLIFDEFYAGYDYRGPDGTTVSSASNIMDVDADDVLIIDGLTKRFRLPGWRVAWIVGPKEFISALGSCGSYLDGGTNVPFQEAAVPMLEPKLVRDEMTALQRHFRGKRDYVLGRLKEIGFHAGEGQSVPDSTFYIWLDLTTLDPPVPEGSEVDISNGLSFFHALLKEKVIVVPGIFFDLNPAHRRDLFDCKYLNSPPFSPSLLPRQLTLSSFPPNSAMSPFRPPLLRAEDGGVAHGPRWDRAGRATRARRAFRWWIAFPWES